jgi:hypothetical protein
MDGRWQCETFTDSRLAADFRTAVEVAGHRWPEGWVKGYGWRAPEPEPEPVRVSVTDVALGASGYFAEQEKRMRRGKVKPYTVHRDRRAFALHLEELFGTEVFAELSEESGQRLDR